MKMRKDTLYSLREYKLCVSPSLCTKVGMTVVTCVYLNKNFLYTVIHVCYLPLHQVSYDSHFEEMI